MAAARPDSTDQTASAVSTVLVVEADVLVRMAVSGYLRECGFKVAEASSPDEAMRMLRADFPVDVVFIGLAGSGNPDGFGIARWIRRERPSIKVSLAAGLGRTVKEAEHLCEHGPVLRKPYDHQELERHIRHLLAQ